MKILQYSTHNEEETNLNKREAESESSERDNKGRKV